MGESYWLLWKIVKTERFRILSGGKTEGHGGYLPLLISIFFLLSFGLEQSIAMVPWVFPPFLPSNIASLEAVHSMLHVHFTLWVVVNRGTEPRREMEIKSAVD